LRRTATIKIYFLVVGNYGQLGPAVVETDLGEADLETTINDLMSGQYSDPVRIVAFNTAEHSSEDPLSAVSISPGMSCRHRSRRSSTSTRSGPSTEPATELIVSWDQRFFRPDPRAGVEGRLNRGPCFICRQLRRPYIFSEMRWLQL
jgi:hypothetical protein